MTDDNPQFCPVCDQPRPVIFLAYGWRHCRTCGAEFTIAESLKASQSRALKTIHEVVEKMREKRE